MIGRSFARGLSRLVVMGLDVESVVSSVGSHGRGGEMLAFQVNTEGDGTRYGTKAKNQRRS